MSDKQYNDEGLPIIPALPKARKQAADGAIAICGECGLRIKPIMGYVCGKSRCPVFPTTSCGTGTAGGPSRGRTQ